MRSLFLHEDGKPDRGNHEDDGAPGGDTGEQVGGGARSEGCLGALAAEGSGEIGTLALLKKDDPDQEQTNKYVHYDKQINHSVAFLSRTLNKLVDILVRKRGLEPLCLSAPPPQDGVSAISPLPHLMSGCPLKV